MASVKSEKSVAVRFNAKEEIVSMDEVLRAPPSNDTEGDNDIEEVEVVCCSKLRSLASSATFVIRVTCVGLFQRAQKILFGSPEVAVPSPFEASSTSHQA